MPWHSLRAPFVALCYRRDSYSHPKKRLHGALQRTRFALRCGAPVSGVLLSGDHAKVRAWREEEARAKADAGAARVSNTTHERR